MFSIYRRTAVNSLEFGTVKAMRISSNVDPGIDGLSMVMVIDEVAVGWNPHELLS